MNVPEHFRKFLKIAEDFQGRPGGFFDDTPTNLSTI